MSDNQKNIRNSRLRESSSDSFRRIHRKSILFNARELSAIEQFCDKYGIKSKSSFFRSIIISHILEQSDENHPKLF